MILQNRSRSGFGGGAPRGGGAGATAGLILLGLGGWVLSNSLFNGEDNPADIIRKSLY